MEILKMYAEMFDLSLDSVALDRFALYAKLLAERAADMNLVADPSREEVEVRHFLDSLMCMKATSLFHVKQASLIDVGTGAGFPGLPLKIACPHLKLTLLDSNGKRCDFLSEVVRELGLSDVTVVNGRAEETAHLAAHRAKYTLATARAVTDMRMLSELCLPFVRHGGELLAMKSRKAVEEGEVERSRRAVAELGGEALPEFGYSLPSGIEMCVVRIEKTAATPPHYPRTWAKIKKSPL